MTELPHHPDIHTFAWTLAELEAIGEYGRKCRRTALEEAIELCSQISDAYWDEFQNGVERGVQRVRGLCLGAEECAENIKKLIAKL